MANSFSKQEIVAFDKVFEAFNDGLVVSRLFGTYNVDNTTAERAGNTVWRPMPYIAQSFTGIDQSANFNRNYTQLAVPTTLGFTHSVPLTLSATELRDALQEGRLGDAAKQKRKDAEASKEEREAQRELNRRMKELRLGN